jgi:hypothetical protein
MKKTPGPTKAEPSAPNSANSTDKARFTARQSRLLEALLTTHGWIPRESVDRITGASNGPQIVSELRAKVTGHDGIDMLRVDGTDRDGKACKPGQYRLTAIGRQRALTALAKDAGAA